MSGGEIVQIAHSIVFRKGLQQSIGRSRYRTDGVGLPSLSISRRRNIQAGRYPHCKFPANSFGLNCIFAGLTIFPIYAIASRSFGPNVAVVASWVWVILPSAWQIPVRLAWDSTLNALSFAVIFWATLAVRGQRRLWIWACYGVLWAIGALINASVLSLAPFLLGWLLWELRKESVAWLKPLTTAVLVLALGVAPWTIRNYLVFRQGRSYTVKFRPAHMDGKPSGNSWI